MQKKSFVLKNYNNILIFVFLIILASVILINYFKDSEKIIGGGDGGGEPPPPGGCINGCGSEGSKICLTGNTYKRCGNYDADSCLEWSDTVGTIGNCNPEEICAVSGCVIPCTNGQCVDSGIKCVNQIPTRCTGATPFVLIINV